MAQMLQELETELEARYETVNRRILSGRKHADQAETEEWRDTLNPVISGANRWL
jgi:hypothetical protein